MKEKAGLRNTNIVDDSLELYFIQFLFMKNRQLLRKENRNLYDALFDRYIKEWKQIPSGTEGILEILNNNFLVALGMRNK